MTDYCFPDVTIEELADKLLDGIYPHQTSPKVRLKCQTFAIALKSLPQDDPRTERLFEIFNRGFDELVKRADRAEPFGPKDPQWVVESLGGASEAHHVAHRLKVPTSTTHHPRPGDAIYATARDFGKGPRDSSGHASPSDSRPGEGLCAKSGDKLRALANTAF